MASAIAIASLYDASKTSMHVENEERSCSTATTALDRGPGFGQEYCYGKAVFDDAGAEARI
jgi:hypothetical protein